MLVYWSMFTLPAVGALLGFGEQRKSSSVERLLFGLLFLGYALLIGMRNKVGADWFGYELIINMVQYERLGTAMSHYDPAFNLTAWISGHLGFGMYGVNFICGVLLLIGLVRLSRTFPNPWLAVTAAVPYLLIVVGMGYIRQAAAIGLCMLGFTYLQRGAYVRFLAAFGLAMTFHVASLCLVPIIAAVLARRSFALLVAISALGAAVFIYILSARLDSVQSIYVKGQLDSAGTLVRLLMTAIPAMLFLALRRRFDIPQPMKGIWTVMAVTAIALLGLFLVSPSSTAIDRIGLFFSPLQVMVLGHLTSVAGRAPAERQLVTVAALTYCAAILFVWLQFSFYAKFWVPYQSIL